MKCPKCGKETRVMCSRSDGKIVARRRKCKSCECVFYTSEKITTTARADFSMIEWDYKSNLKRRDI